MAHYLQNRFREEIIDSTDEFEAIDLDGEEVESVLDQGVEIHHPSHTLNCFISGESLHSAKRKEPTTVYVDLRDILSGTSSVIAGAAIPNPYISGIVVLLTLMTIGLPNKQDLTAYQALTYGVGWELVDDKDTFVIKDNLINKVVDRNREIDVIKDMDEETVDNALQELDRINCVEIKESDGDALVWFRENFKIEYSY